MAAIATQLIVEHISYLQGIGTIYAIEKGFEEYEFVFKPERKFYLRVKEGHT